MKVTAPNGCGWSTASNAGWIIVTSGANSSGDGLVTYTLRENFTATTRTGTISIAGHTFTVRQEGTNNCSFSLSSTSKSFPRNGGTGTVNVAATIGCGWTATSNAGWLTITSGASAAGNGVVTYSVSINNTNFPRAGTMLIAGKTFSVKQKAR